MIVVLREKQKRENEMHEAKDYHHKLKRKLLVVLVRIFVTIYFISISFSIKITE